MEVDDEIQTPQQARKFSRVSSNGGRIDSSKLSNESTAAVVNKNRTPTATSITAITTPTADVLAVATNRLRQWPHSSRIIRVSRASGGKDRHSKVWTARGPRDRRVRLSVNTAIQFYDLQDRLGYEQPSKAVEWLIKAAEDAINELPALNSCSTFPPETLRQLSDERQADSAEPDPDGGLGLGQSQQQQQITRSGCSSNNSENSKGSGLSLSRSEIRVKARERARERTAKEKERENEPTRANVSSHAQQQQQQQNVSTMPQTSSFTQLLTAGINNLNESNAGPASSSPGPSSLSPDVGLFQKQARGNNSTNQWLSASTAAMDYFGSSLMGTSSSRLIQLGNTSHSLPHQLMTISSLGDNHHHQQQQSSHSHGLQNHQHHHQQQYFPFVSDLVQVPNTGAGGVGASGNLYNFNFTISSSSTSSGGLGGAGFNRGTLQSNSTPSLLPYLQRYSATDGSSMPFFLGGAPTAPAEEGQQQQQHHQFQPPGLHLCYGEGGRHQSDQKGKPKN